MPFYLQPKPVAVAETPGKCCARKQQAGELPCQQPSKDCNTGSCCTHCPIGAAATLTALQLPVNQEDNSKKEYSRYLSHYFYTYFATSWKPPNGCQAFIPRVGHAILPDITPYV